MLSSRLCLLDTAYEIEDNQATTRSGELVAGTWWIPGVGKVVVTVAGAILVSGAVITAGSWVYDTVIEWFEQKAIEDDYEDAKDDGTKTDNHSEQVGGPLDTKGDPFSSTDQYTTDGDLKQRRYYGEDGKADMDIDYRHGGVGHTFPHRHDWINGSRGDAY